MDDQEKAARLTQLTVNLTDVAFASLLEAAKITGDPERDTRTVQIDVINRALQIFAFIAAREAEGWQIAMFKDKEIKTVDFK